MRKFNVIFLGERKISQSALDVLLTGKFAEHFDLKVLVSNPDFYALAKRKHAGVGDAEFISNAKRHAEEIQAAIARHKVNLLLSVQHIWILPQSIMDAVQGNAFNLHNSALPEYKGYNSISHAIIDGAPEFRTTIHWMAREVDSGDIAFQGRIPIQPTDTALSLYKKSVSVAAEQFGNLLEAVVRGEVPRAPLRGEGKFYYRADLEKMKDVSHEADGARLERIVRASYFPPLQPAYQMVGGKKVYLIPEQQYAELVAPLPLANQPVE